MNKSLTMAKHWLLVYDYIMLTDFDPRNRPIGETPKLVYEGLIKGGFQTEKY